MKTVKKVRKIVIDGQVKKTEDVKEKVSRLDEPKEVVVQVVDSVAQHYKIQAQRELAEAKEKKSNKDIVIWEEVEEKKASKKSDSKK
ncbi:hypothetical protein [Christiangramia crocea]|uniref:Uncharacterized protein n=1 Tax=Christiangramia crocea TaxID=2904124 RepID=A0A9X1UWW8_9FLAO|nr:hypothetical protein [Gramella crocea]MCG9970999.1 hypothetical protein [Gramella crocea]